MKMLLVTKELAAATGLRVVFSDLELAVVTGLRVVFNDLSVFI